MMPPQERISEILVLLAQLNEGALSEEQEARLRQLVAEDVTTRRFYLEMMFFYGQLRWKYTHGSEEEAGQASSPISSFLGFLGQTVEWGTTVFSRRVNSPILAALLIAGLVLTLTIIWLLPAPPPARQSPSREYAAQVTRMQDCIWAKGSTSLKQGDDVPREKVLGLTSGLLEITLSIGAQISLEGPCRFQMKAAAEGYLQEGRLLARADAKSAKGLTISTPFSKVVDLGTEFGIVVDPKGTTEVHVLRGLVNVAYHDLQGKVLQGRMLQQGQAQRFTVKDAVAVNIPANPPAFQAMQSFSASNPLQRWQACRDRLARDPALVLYYPFEEDRAKSGKLVNLSPAGDALDGQIVKAKWAPGRFPGKQALYFRGPKSTDYVQVPQEQLFDFAEPFTVLIWFRVDQFNAPNQTLISKGVSSWTINRYGERDQLTFNTTNLEKKKKGQDYFDYLRTKKRSVKDRRWHCVAAVCESINPTIKKSIYLDGVRENSAEIPGPLKLNDQPVCIGNRSPVSARKFCGWIDEVAVFRRALNTEEIAQIYREGNPYHAPEAIPRASFWKINGQSLPQPDLPNPLRQSSASTRDVPVFHITTTRS